MLIYYKKLAASYWSKIKSEQLAAKSKKEKVVSKPKKENTHDKPKQENIYPEASKIKKKKNFM